MEEDQAYKEEGAQEDSELTEIDNEATEDMEDSEGHEEGTHKGKEATGQEYKEGAWEGKE